MASRFFVVLGASPLRLDGEGGNSWAIRIGCSARALVGPAVTALHFTYTAIVDLASDSNVSDAGSPVS